MPLVRFRTTSEKAVLGRYRQKRSVADCGYTFLHNTISYAPQEQKSDGPEDVAYRIDTPTAPGSPEIEYHPFAT